jgi:hypothetical protein
MEYVLTLDYQGFAGNQTKNQGVRKNAIFRLRISCSTAELRRHLRHNAFLSFFKMIVNLVDVLQTPNQT